MFMVNRKGVKMLLFVTRTATKFVSALLTSENVINIFKKA